MAGILCILCVWSTWCTERQLQIRMLRRSDFASWFAFVNTLNSHTIRTQTPSFCASWVHLVPYHCILIVSGALGCYHGDPWLPLRNSLIVWCCPLASWHQISLPHSQGFILPLPVQVSLLCGLASGSHDPDPSSSDAWLLLPDFTPNTVRPLILTGHVQTLRCDILTLV